MQFQGDAKQYWCEDRASNETSFSSISSAERDFVKPVGKQQKRILFIMHEARTCSGRVGRWFCQQGYNIDICKPRWGDRLPESLESYQGVVIFGGNMSVNDSLDYLQAEMDWLNVPLKEKKPVLGICLGAQLLVKFLGGHVVPHKEGIIESGYVPVSSVKNSPIQQPELLPEMVYEWHREGFSLPTGMRRFLTGQVFENQAVLFDDLHVGFQFHPEVTERILRRWITLLPEMLLEKGSQPALKQIEKHLRNCKQSEKWLDAFLTAWSAQEFLCKK